MRIHFQVVLQARLLRLCGALNFVPLLASHMIISGLVLVFSIVCILLFAPVNHPGLMLAPKEQRKYRNWGRGILFMETGAAVYFDGSYHMCCFHSSSKVNTAGGENE